MKFVRRGMSQLQILLQKMLERKSKNIRVSCRRRLIISQIRVNHRRRMNQFQILLENAVGKNKKKHKNKKFYSESESDTESSSSDEKRKKRHRRKSGLVSKIKDKVKRPQHFPHNVLQYEYVSKKVEFKELTFNMFVAGELEIINNFAKSVSEKRGRERLLLKIAYFSTIYKWDTLLDFYAAWLRQIELGKKSWGDDTQSIEAPILSGHFITHDKSRTLQGKSGQRKEVKDSVLFCYKFQRNKCEFQKSPHDAILRGTIRTVHHICATCFQQTGAKLEHPECSPSCPNQKNTEKKK